MSATDATRYRIVERGNPGWIVVRRFNEHGCRMVEVHNPDLAHMTFDNGPAVVRCPESHLIPAAGTPRAVVDAPAEAVGNGTAGASSPVAAIPVAAPDAARPVPHPGLAALSTTEAGRAKAVAAHVDPLAGSGVGPGPASTHRGARNTDPDTSMEAAESVDDHSRRSAYDTILRILFEHGPQTDWQLGQRMGLLATSAGKRRGELRDMGLVYQTKDRGPTSTGDTAAWRHALTAQGAEVAA